mgnify:CR=1 FL=1
MSHPANWPFLNARHLFYLVFHGEMEIKVLKSAAKHDIQRPPSAISVINLDPIEN